MCLALKKKHAYLVHLVEEIILRCPVQVRHFSSRIKFLFALFFSIQLQVVDMQLCGVTC
jgi:hypothetical protein